MSLHRECRRVTLAAVAAVMVMAVVACRGSSTDSGDVYASEAIVRRGTLATVVQMAGKVISANAAELNFPIGGGRVAEILVQNGQEVASGQKLMRLDTSGLQRLHREAQADLQAAEAALVAAQKGVGASELDKAEADLAYARCEAEAAKIEVELAEKRGFQRLREAVADAEFALQVARDELRLKEIGEGQATIRALEYDQAFFERLLRDLPAGDPERLEAEKRLADTQRDLARVRRAREDALDAARDVVVQREYELSLAQGELARALSGAMDPSNSARLAYRAAVETLDAAQRKVDALRAGGESDAVAAARTAYEAALAAVHSAQAAVEAATLYAPFDGTVLAIYVSPNDSVGAGQPVMLLADLRQLQLDAQVTEMDISRIELGQAVRVSFDVYPGRLFAGEVIQLPHQTMNQSGMVYYRVITSLDHHEALIRLGMYANVRIVIGERQDVLTIPAAAVRYDDAGKTYVSLKRPDGTVVPRSVDLGINDGIAAEVLAGLEEGDTVMVPLMPATNPYGPGPVPYW